MSAEARNPQEESTMKDEKIKLLKDALYYTRSDSGASEETAQGVVIGAVSVLMGIKGIAFYDALDIIKAHMPDGFELERIPAAWRESWKIENKEND
jgi:hypothetical protein